jgi:hypothetical protein
MNYWLVRLQEKDGSSIINFNINRYMKFFHLFKLCTLMALISACIYLPAQEWVGSQVDRIYDPNKLDIP